MSGRPNDPTYDAVVVGTGSGGKLAAIELSRQGRQVLAVEAGRFGGECPYVACVPAKSLLLSARSGLTWAEAVLRREEATDGRDDEGSRRSLTDEGVQVLRGRARLSTRPHHLDRPLDGHLDGHLDGQPGGHRLVIEPNEGPDLVVSASVVVLAPGSAPVRPDLPGLDDVPTWTSDQALSTSDQPGRLAILGGGAVGCELAQAFAGLGTQVTIVEVADRLLPGETPWVGELVAAVLAAEGIKVHTGRSAVRVGPEAGGAGGSGGSGASRVELVLDDGRSVGADRLLLAGGRAPRTDDLGLAAVGAARESSGAIPVDRRCRVLDEGGRPIDGLFAVGDATAASSFTHSANYQARVVAAQVDGRGYDADYVAVPRAVYLDPRRLLRRSDAGAGARARHRRARRRPSMSARSSGPPCWPARSGRPAAALSGVGSSWSPTLAPAYSSVRPASAPRPTRGEPSSRSPSARVSTCTCSATTSGPSPRGPRRSTPPPAPWTARC